MGQHGTGLVLDFKGYSSKKEKKLFYIYMKWLFYKSFIFLMTY